jgi:hypothetical protein
MIVHSNVDQGSADWLDLRLGIPTASCADQIITPKTGKLSASSQKYAYKLAVERLLRIPTESVEGQEWMDRGKTMEPKAVEQYEWVNEVETTKVGFITTDDGAIGASPDRLIKGKPAGLEIKVPAPWTHLAYLLDGHNEAYRPQVQCQLLVCEFDYVDFYSYSDRMPARLIRTPRDEAYIKLLRAALTEFNERLFVMVERARTLGAFQAAEAKMTPLDAGMGDELERAFGLPPLPGAKA